jgi:chitin disaccharide deacetylase
MAGDVTLIVNADDLGYDPAVTRGILRAMRDGVVSSTTLMVNTPYAEEAATAAADFPVGLHLNLARHPPVWRQFPSALLEAGELLEQRASTLPPEVVEAETAAQLQKAEQLLGRRPTHLDVHKHLHRHAQVLEGVLRAARHYGVPVRSIDAAMRATLHHADVLTNDHFVGDAGASPYWTLERLVQKVALLQPGVTELMCHPGLAPEQVKSAYASQREVELATLTHPHAREVLERAGAHLADWSALAD